LGRQAMAGSGVRAAGFGSACFNSRLQAWAWTDFGALC
jgi:hypothetical protein